MPNPPIRAPQRKRQTGLIVACVLGVVLILGGAAAGGIYYLHEAEDNAGHGVDAVEAALPTPLRNETHCEEQASTGLIRCTIPAGSQLTAGLVKYGEQTLVAEIERAPAQDARNLRSGIPYAGDLVDTSSTVSRIPANGNGAGLHYVNVRSGLHIDAEWFNDVAAVKTFMRRAGL